MRPHAGGPWRPLAVLTLLVAGGHALLLQGLPPTLSWQRSPAAPVLVRTLLPPLPLPVPVPPEPRPPAAVAPGAAPAQPKPAAARPAPAAPAAPAAAAPVAPLPRLPAPATWRYEVRALQRGLPVSGRAELAWRHDSVAYEATFRIEAPPLPLRVQRSSGAVDAEGLHPARFSERLRTEAATHFQRDQGRIVFSSNRPDAPLLTGAQDRLSVLLQLAGVVAADPGRFTPGTTVPVQTAGTREADTWLLVAEGTDALDLPGGAVQALKFTRAPRGDYDPRLELWFGPADYGLVRLRLTAPNGDWLDLQWSGTDKG